MANGKKTDQQRIGAAERRIKVLAYRRGGASYRAIVDALGVSIATVHDDLQRAYAELRQQQNQHAEDAIILENARLDDLQRAVWPMAMQGNFKAVGSVLRIMERRARLNGLDAQPGTELPPELNIILRWADGRNIIDVTPDNGSMASPTPQIAESDSAAPGALPMHLRWSEMGKVETGGDAESEDSA